MKKTKTLLLLVAIFIASILQAQTNYYGLTSKGGNSKAGVIFKTNTSGASIQTAYTFEFENPGKTPSGILTEATNGKLYGVTTFGGENTCSFSYYGMIRNSGVMYEYDPSTSTYSVLYNFDDTASGCWPKASPIEASNGLLYGVVNSGGTRNYGTIYSYNRTTSTYTKIHNFEGSYASVGYDGVRPVGNLLEAADGKLYGVTNGGGYNGHGTIFKIDPATSTYTKLLDLQVSYSGANAGYGPETGLIQAPNGIMYGTTQAGGTNNYGNIYKYNPSTNVATSLYSFSNSDNIGVYPYGNIIMIGTDSLYGINYKYYYSSPSSSYPDEAHFYLWRYQISTGNIIVVDSIANGNFNKNISLTSNGKILLTGYDNNISNAIRFWEFNPATRTKVLKDTSSTLSSNTGIMQASNGKFYGGFADVYGTPYSNGLFVEYDMNNNLVNTKFRFSNPINGVYPLGDLMMATNGKLYGTTSEGGLYDKGVVFEYNPVNGNYAVKFNLDSLSGYAPKDGLMEASNGKFYLLTYMGGTSGDGSLIEIDTTNWSMLKKVDFNSSLGRKPMGKVTEAWDGKLYGLTAYDGGGLFQYNISTGAIVQKYSFTNASGTYPQGSLILANNGKLYGLTNSGGASYYSHGTFFEYDPATDTFVMKKEMLQYLGYYSAGNSPLQASDGNIYMPITAAGSGNTDYEGGTIDAFDGTLFSNKAVFSVSNTGSKPMGDLMEAANGKFYGYTYQGGTNNYGTVFEFDASTNVITKKVDFDESNGANPIHGSMTEVGLSNITITQQPTISSNCIGDSALITITATHTTLLHYQWFKNGSRIAGATNDTLFINSLSASDNGTYYCKITGGARAVISNNLVVSTSAKPTVSIGTMASSYCLNNVDINLTATPTGGNFSGMGVSGSVFSPSNAGTGNVDILYSYTNASGCSNSDTASVTINSLPDASFSGYNSTYCDNSIPSTLIPTTAGGTFTGNGISGNIFDPSFYAGGGGLMLFNKIKYEITDANSCYNADSVIVTIYHTPPVTISGLDTIYCENGADDTLVTSPTGGTITAGGFLAGNIFTPSNATIGYNYIYYSYTNSNNCTNADTIKIKVNATPDASFTGLASAYCNNDDADTLVVATIGGSFSGNIVGMVFDPNQIVIPANVISVPKSITYTVTNADGCTDSTTNATTIFPLPIVDFGSLVPTICNNGFPILLNAGTPSGGIYSGNGIQGISFVPADAPLGNDTLIYSYTNGNSCTNIDTAIIDILAAPEFTLGNDTGICINNFITLATKMGAGYIYLWSDGSTDSTLLIDASTLGTGVYTYSVTTTDPSNNCVEIDDIELTVNACIGINNPENDNLEISVYPNPSSGIFNIESEIKFETLEIYSEDGRLIYTQNVKDKGLNYQINLQNQSKGVYYLLLNNSQSTERKQLILK